MCSLATSWCRWRTSARSSRMFCIDFLIIRHYSFWFWSVMCPKFLHMCNLCCQAFLHSLHVPDRSLCVSAFQFRRIGNVHLIKSKKGKKKWERNSNHFEWGWTFFHLGLVHNSQGMRDETAIVIPSEFQFTLSRRSILGETGKPWCRTCWSEGRRRKKSMLTVKKKTFSTEWCVPMIVLPYSHFSSLGSFSFALFRLHQTLVCSA